MAKPKVKAQSAKGAAQEKRFVEEYLTDLNAARAARAIGHSEKSAEKFGCLMLQRPSVAKAVQEAMDARSAKTGITAERVLNELAKMAFCDPRKFYREDGSLKHPTELDDDTAASLAGMEVEEAYQHFGGGQAKPTGLLKKIKIADKGQNLERLGRHLKLFTDRVEHAGLDALAAELEKARLRVQA